LTDYYDILVAFNVSGQELELSTLNKSPRCWNPYWAQAFRKFNVLNEVHLKWMHH